MIVIYHDQDPPRVWSDEDDDMTVDEFLVWGPYISGYTKPNYPVPALWDVYPDEEYLVMLYEHALLTQTLRDIRNETIS